MLVTKTSVIKMDVHFIYNICYLFGSACYYSTGSNKLNNDLVAILFALMKIEIMLSELIDDGWLAANRLMATGCHRHDRCVTAGLVTVRPGHVDCLHRHSPALFLNSGLIHSSCASTIINC